MVVIMPLWDTLLITIVYMVIILTKVSYDAINQKDKAQPVYDFIKTAL